jgi:XTP/dITP diphosphohydrolase
VLALVRDASDASPLVAQGVWEGSIAAEPLGANGFGYDPLFIPRGMTLHAAQLRAELKNRLSHRALATAELVRQLERVSW